MKALFVWVVAVWAFLMGLFVGLTTVRAHSEHAPLFAQYWLQEQRVPHGEFQNQSCCTMADVEEVEEDIRGGVYWTRFERTAGKWIPVPPEVVIKDPNHNGAPVAWWYYENGELKIRCYAPGGGA